MSDELIEELAKVVTAEVLLNLDRERVKTALLEAFGQASKKAVEAQVLQHRLDQLGQLATNLTITLDEDQELLVHPGPQDWAIYQALKFGCEWHDPIDLVAAVSKGL
jgi:hypothetical protein